MSMIFSTIFFIVFVYLLVSCSLYFLKMNRIGDFAIYVDICVNKLKIYLIMSNQSFYGELPFSYLDSLSNQLEMSFDECKRESISALTTCNGIPHFDYKFDSSNSRFVWIKNIKGCPFGLFYGIVDMEPSEQAATVMLYVNLVTNITNHYPNGNNVSKKFVS